MRQSRKQGTGTSAVRSSRRYLSLIHIYLEIIEELDPIVEKYFNEYGAEKVRGGRFPIVDEKLHLKKVFERYKIDECKYIRYTQKEMNHLKYERKKSRKTNNSKE